MHFAIRPSDDEVRRMMLVKIFPLLVLIAGTAGLASPRADNQAFSLERKQAILREFIEFLSVPNVSSDKTNIRRNAEHLAGMMRIRGIEARLLETEGGPPVVYGELRAPASSRKTLLIYAHYDGQPVDAESWTDDPWTPVLRTGTILERARIVSAAAIPGQGEDEWRLYGRGTSDDKGTIVAVLAALDLLKERRTPLSVNVRFLFEGEEENGSPHLEAFLKKKRDLFRADGMLLCDGPVHQTRRPQIVFGARGVMGLEMTVFGPDRALHSGHYGNWAPNPAAVLATIIAALRNKDGKILIPGFLDDVRPLTAAEGEAIRVAPSVDEDLRREFGLGWSEAGGGRLEERIMLPGLNIRGLSSGNVGAKVQNAIPIEAVASIDFRLVPDQEPAKVRERVDAFVRSLGYEIVHKEPSLAERRQAPRYVRMRWGSGYPAYREDMDGPFGRALIETLYKATDGTLIKMPALGGSIPMEMFHRTLGLPVVLFPIANHDNNQHGPDENIRLRNLWDGIRMHAALLSELGSVWKN